MTTDNYTRSMAYEVLVRRAYKSEATSRNGGHLSIMSNLIDAENGIKHYGLPTAEKQRDKVKIYLIKAVEKFLKMKFTEEEKSILTYHQRQIDQSYSSDELLSIVDALLKLTHRFK